jgi:hypothetical protein
MNSAFIAGVYLRQKSLLGLLIPQDHAAGAELEIGCQSHRQRKRVLWLTTLPATA